MDKSVTSPRQDLPVLAITLGDPAGIGPEQVAKMLAADVFKHNLKAIIVGDEAILRRGMRDTGVNVAIPAVKTIEEAVNYPETVLLQLGNLDAGRIAIGKTTPENGRDQGDVLLQCIQWCKSGFLEGIVFAPLNKGAMKMGGHNFPSEHEMFAHCYGITGDFGEMNVLDGLWNIRVTSHIPLEEVASSITKERILKTARLGYAMLHRVGYEQPRIAVAALNPHAGEEGTCGRQEIDIIIPALQEAEKEGMTLEGPYPCDTLFLKAFQEKFDGVITMYHDQGQIAIKLKGFEHCVTVSTGLPHAITTPAHGTAYDIAGTGKCSISAFIDAVQVCAKIALNDRKNKN